MFSLQRSPLEYVLIAISALCVLTAPFLIVGLYKKGAELGAEQAAHLVTKDELRTCNAQLATANAKVDEQNAKVEAWVDRAAQYKKAADEAQEAAARQAKKYQSTIAKLRSVPLPTEQCPQTRAYVQQYLNEERAQ